jgi:hypothetical protein
VRVLTNGLQLHRQTPAFWLAVDELHISVYPNTSRVIDTQRELISRRAAQARTRVTFKFFDHFRVSFRPNDNDHELTRLIYATCQIGNRWRCLTVEDGMLYRCPQSALLAQYSKAVHTSDGIRIDGSAYHRVACVDRTPDPVAQLFLLHRQRRTEASSSDAPAGSRISWSGARRPRIPGAAPSGSRCRQWLRLSTADRGIAPPAPGRGAAPTIVRAWKHQPSAHS